MELYKNISLSQARKDLKYLKDTYGITNDFCGAFCNINILTNILMGKISIKEAVIENILYYFDGGLEREWILYSQKLPNKDDKRVEKIIERYCIDL